MMINSNNPAFRQMRLEAHGFVIPFALTPNEVVARMGAMQAQDFNMAKWAVGIRLEGCTEKAVIEAFNKGEILRTHVLRPTWHFVSPENIRAFLLLSADKIKSATRARDRELGLSEELFTKANNIITKELEGNNHRTSKELGEALQRAGIETDSARMYHFMMRAEVEALVCSGALQGSAQTYALLDERAPQTARLTREEAISRLAGAYFSSHYPATMQDFMWWSGLSTGDARKGLEAIKQYVITENIAGQDYFFKAHKTIQKKSGTSSFHLLPAFDEYIIAYRDRTPVISTGQHSKAISSNGIFRPVIIADGEVIGLWRKAASKANPLTFEFFQQSDSDDEKSIGEAVREWKAFYDMR
ncbi:MAG: winged helix DNA-binding domain-containing protein [Tannerella sp.]|jgi:hypothetical protein|nr:winged helix DNA-binding domain-containing protein [Tannerella sp.]